MPKGHKLRDVHVFDDNSVIAIGEAGIIIRTTNGGVTLETTNEEIQIKYVLYQNYPDLFNPTNSIIMMYHNTTM